MSERRSGRIFREERERERKRERESKCVSVIEHAAG